MNASIRGFECDEHSNEAMGPSRARRWPGHSPCVMKLRGNDDPVYHDDPGSHGGLLLEGSVSAAAELRETTRLLLRIAVLEAERNRGIHLNNAQEAMLAQKDELLAKRLRLENLFDPSSSPAHSLDSSGRESHFSSNAENAERWLGELQFLGLSPDMETYRSMIRSCIDTGMSTAEKYFTHVIPRSLVQIPSKGDYPTSSVGIYAMPART